MKMKKTVLGSLFKKPATLMYPVIPREYPEISKGHIAVDMSACILCGICARKCPTHAIQVDRASKTWTIERMRCIQCRCCTGYCPKNCLTMENSYTAPSTGKTVDSYTAPEPEEKKEPVAEQ
ncbi:MAG: 4Fe-4S binding protein [Bacillota bacterium]|nr:4Fe-4S binding protein [Bacillota bacterium]